MKRACAVVLCSLSAVGAQVGCGPIPEHPYDLNTPAENRLEQFAKTQRPGSARPLRSFTDFSWDAVWIFLEGTDLEKIDGALGQEYFGKEGYLEVDSLLVFMRGRKIVHSFGTIVIGEEGGRFTADEASVEVTAPYNVRFFSARAP